MKLIDKDALVAEIERRIEEYKDMKIDSSYYEGMVASLEFFRDEFINSLEVKEVDLKKEIDIELETRWRGEYLSTSKFRESAKYFFELGLKAQKGEEV